MNKFPIILISSLLANQIVVAQAPGSETMYGGANHTKSISAGSSSDAAETLYIGPGNYIINGIWEIYSKNIIIDPAANINGSGSIQIYNPSIADGAASRNFLDGNNLSNSVNVNIILNNASGMEITELPFPSSLVSAGFTNNINNTPYIGADLNLAADGANIWLDDAAVGDLRFDADATISNFSASRMVVTNNVNISHVVKDAGGTTFVYPVGIAGGDYTPAAITGTGAYHVNVTDYSNPSVTINAPEEGMARLWHVYGDAANSITLTHNNATDGSAYTDAQGFITRYEGSDSWSTAAPPDYISAGVHTNATTISAGIPATAADNTSFLTKASDATTPLPIDMISFEVQAISNNAFLQWTIIDNNDNKGFVIERQATAGEWKKIGYVKSDAGVTGSDAKMRYNFTDANTLPGLNFYRLRIEALDGSYVYSPVRFIDMQKSMSVKIWPSPFTQHIAISGLTGNENILLYTPKGRLITQTTANAAGNLSLDHLGHLTAGIYILKIIAANGTATSYSIIKQ